MTIGSISSQQTQPFPPPQNGQATRFGQVAQSVQSGNLQAAQQAYATFLQNAPSQIGQGGSSTSVFAQTVSQIGSALSAGDLSSAQSALQSLQAHHHPHGAHGDQTAGQGTTTQAATGTQSATNQVDVTA